MAGGRIRYQITDDVSSRVARSGGTRMPKGERRIIADYVLAAGETVFHTLGPGHVEQAQITPAARRGPDGVWIYPA